MSNEPVTNRWALKEAMGALRECRDNELEWDTQEKRRQAEQFYDAIISRLQAISDELNELARLREATRWRDASKEWPGVGTVVVFETTTCQQAVGRVEVWPDWSGVQWLTSESVTRRCYIKRWTPLPAVPKDGDK